MKAFVFAETSDAARALCAGVRKYASRVIFVAIGDMDVPNAIADEVAYISIPEGRIYDDAADTVLSYYDEEVPGLVFSESTRRLKTVVGKLCAHAGAAAITDVTALWEDCAQSLYFGGIGQRKLRAHGLRVCTMSPATLCYVY
jgi:electron transfer flavoprotein alpha subunit